jgi:hypothetical protein
MSNGKKKPKKTNFIVLIGGPGTFESCDREHDQTWTNYIVPIQVATEKKQLDIGANEVLHWWVYGPAYDERWVDDVADTSDPKAPNRGQNLIDSRKKAVDSVIAKGATSYLDRIKRVAGSAGATFREIKKPQDFWDELKALPDKSVSRVWYIGHASANGLMLKLVHRSSDCAPAAAPGDMITVADISSNAPSVASKMITKGKASKFYGCFTESFATEWNKLFSVTTEGAVSKIDFGVIDRESKIEKIMPRLEQSKPDTKWKTIGAP